MLYSDIYCFKSHSICLKHKIIDCQLNPSCLYLNNYNISLLRKIKTQKTSNIYRSVSSSPIFFSFKVVAGCNTLKKSSVWGEWKEKYVPIHFGSKKIAFAISRNHVLLDTRGGGRRESTLACYLFKNKSFEDFVKCSKRWKAIVSGFSDLLTQDKRED